MSGETEQQVSAWTVDSLREHFTDLINETDRRYEQRFEGQEKAIGTAMTAYEAAITLVDTRFVEKITTVEAEFNTHLTGLRTLYDTVLAERDQRHTQRVESLETAFKVAVDTLTNMVGTQIMQVREETILAMAAAEKAIIKAENATEKRFESVNEFRAQQADIISTFARKSEIDTRMSGLTEKVDNFHTQSTTFAASSMPRAEYDRAHNDLAERVVQVEKSLAEKLEAQVKAFEGRIALLQSQLSAIEAVTR